MEATLEHWAKNLNSVCDSIVSVPVITFNTNYAVPDKQESWRRRSRFDDRKRYISVRCPSSTKYAFHPFLTVSPLLIHCPLDGIPPHILQQVTTCAAAANEFLRQFWTATYPPPQDAQTPSSTTPAQRAARAAKMINYLSKTHEKAFALVRTAHQEGADANLVEVVRHLFAEEIAGKLT